MNINEITKAIEPIIIQSVDGQEIENVKIDCKSKWWELKTITGLNEFLKDTCAIANTFGLDGYIIIGFDDKSKMFHDARFSDCGLKDSFEIRNLLIKNVDMVFDVNTFDINIQGNKLSVIHIPPSVDKPHVLRVYKTVDKKGNVREEANKIFIRKNSANYVASKNDIDIMYYDRKNVIPEYKLAVSVSKQSLSVTGSGNAGFYNRMDMSPNLIFENQGTRSIGIVEIELSFSAYINPMPEDEYTFKLAGAKPIIIPVGQIVTATGIFSATGNKYKSIEKTTQMNVNYQGIIVQDIVLKTNIGEVMTLPVMSY
jgi:hypothetical protein